MFARGWDCVHTARLSVPKIPAAKPCVFISSKLIEINRLQVFYSGHLRKTGGRGSYRLVHTMDRVIRKTAPVRWPNLRSACTRSKRPPIRRRAGLKDLRYIEELGSGGGVEGLAFG